MTEYRIAFVGGIHGPMWWPNGVDAGKTIIEDLRIAATDTRPTLRQWLLSIQMKHGGDYQHSTFTADSEILISRDTGIRAGHRTVKSRYWPITAFKSVSDLWDADTLASDYSDG